MRTAEPENSIDDLENEEDQLVNEIDSFLIDDDELWVLECYNIAVINLISENSLINLNLQKITIIKCGWAGKYNGGRLLIKLPN